MFMPATRQILKNLVSLSLAQVITRGLGLIVIAYLARVLGTEEFGKIGFAQAILAYFMLFTDLGLNIFGIREVARNRQEINRYINNILAIRLIASIGAFALLLVFVYFLPNPTETKKLILLYGLSIFTFAFTIDWLFQSIERMEFIILSSLARGFVYVGFIFLIVKSPEQLLDVPLIKVASDAVGVGILFFLLFFVFRKNFSSLKLDFDFGFWKEMMKQSLPMGISSVIVTIYYNFDHIMLGFMKNMEVVGLYSAAYKIIFFLISFQTLINRSILPHLSILWLEKKSRLEHFINVGMSYMFLLSLIVIVSSLSFAPYIIRLIYGEEFQNSIPAFVALSFAVFLAYNQTVAIPFLYASNKQNQRLIASSVGTITNLVFNTLLIPKFSFYGAAIATIIAESCVLLLLLHFLAKTIKINFKFVYFYNILTFLFPLPILFFANVNVFLKFMIFIIIFSLLNLMYRFRVEDPILLRLKHYLISKLKQSTTQV